MARIDNNAQIYYYHVDHLGTPQAMTDSTGTVVWKAYYDPFGNATLRVSTIENNLRLPGQYYDRETGMHYNYFRDYDPTTGRYVEADPMGLEAGTNLYAYVEGNPLRYSDPTGRNPVAGAEAGFWGGTLVCGPACGVIGGIVGAGVGAWLGWNVVGPMVTEARGWFNNAEANREWQAYKDSYSAPMPPGMDPCEQARWQLKREQEQLAARRAWDAKWVPLGAQDHSRAIEQSELAVRNAQKRVERDCKCP